MEIDDVFKKGITKCYTKFNDLREPIISEKDIRVLMNRYMETLPNHYNTLKNMLEFDKKESLSKNSHLLSMKYYDKLIFYKFLSLARVKNTQNCIHWAMVAQGARYARGISNTKSPEQVFLAHRHIPRQ